MARNPFIRPFRLESDGQETNARLVYVPEPSMTARTSRHIPEDDEEDYSYELAGVGLARETV